MTNILFLSAAYLVMLAVTLGGCDKGTNEALKPFHGTYVGIGRAYESPAAYGEIELTVGTDRFKTRQATGNRIESKVVLFSELARMTQDEAAQLFVPISPTASRDIGDGFTRPASCPCYIFVPDPKTGEPALLILGCDDGNEDAILFNSKQVADGSYQAYLDSFRARGNLKLFSRLKNGGKLLPDPID